ncbi:MAG: hypothetical protein WAW91_01810 [Candidatus Nanoperiomorbaceae bacterium]
MGLFKKTPEKISKNKASLDERIAIFARNRENYKKEIAIKKEIKKSPRLSGGSDFVRGLDPLKYYGDCPGFPDPWTGNSINFLDEGIYINEPRGKWDTSQRWTLDHKLFAWNEVKSFEFGFVDESNNSSSRITATRLIAFGFFALAAKKQTSSSTGTIAYIIHTNRGDYTVSRGFGFTSKSGNASGLANNLKIFAEQIKMFVAEKTANNRR